MAKAPKNNHQPEVDPKEGDEILRRMLRTGPKQHKDMVKERPEGPCGVRGAKLRNATSCIGSRSNSGAVAGSSI
jgi:hypothetical protein